MSIEEMNDFLHVFWTRPYHITVDERKGEGSRDKRKQGGLQISGRAGRQGRLLSAEAIWFSEVGSTWKWCVVLVRSWHREPGQQYTLAASATTPPPALQLSRNFRGTSTSSDRPSRSSKGSRDFSNFHEPLNAQGNELYEEITSNWRNELTSL